MASIFDWTGLQDEVTIKVSQTCSSTYWSLESSGLRIYDANKQMIFLELKSNIDE